MTKWRTAPLGDLCSLITDGKHGDCTNDADSGFYFISAKDIREGRVCYEDARQITEKDFAETHRRTDLQHGDILLTNSGTIGRLAIATDDEITRRTTFQKSVAVLKPRREKIGTAFLYYYLAASRSALENAARGAAQKNLLLSELRRLSVIVPPAAQQDRIGSILSSYDDQIENNRRRMGLLEKAARLLYQEWFVGLHFPGHEHTPITHGLPQGWERWPLHAICPDLREAANPADLEPGTPYIGLEHMPRRSITLLERGNAEDVTSTKLRYQADDILFGKIRPYFHKVGFALSDGVTSSDAIVLRPTEPQYYCFSLLTVSSDWFVTIVSKTAKEGAKMPRADWKLMQNHTLTVPPRSLLESLNETVKPILAQLRTLAFQNQKLRTARDLLLPRLMSGEIAV